MCVPIQSSINLLLWLILFFFLALFQFVANVLVCPKEHLSIQMTVHSLSMCRKCDGKARAKNTRFNTDYAAAFDTFTIIQLKNADAQIYLINFS